jgi:hypothetical protein
MASLSFFKIRQGDLGMEKDLPFVNKEMTLLDLLDGVIDTGVVVRGELLISIANIDLIVVDLKLLISAIETAYGNLPRKDISEEARENGTITTGLK